MALQTLVKISGITNLTDARYCAGMGVEMVGFGIDESTNDFIGFQKIQDIIQWLSGVQLVGEIINQNIETVSEYGFDFLETANLQLIDNQVHSNSISSKIILKIVITQENLVQIPHILEKYHTKVSYFLLESELQFDNHIENILKNYCVKYPILLGFGISKTTIIHILNTIKPTGIALKGGIEISPGLKDMDELAEILEIIEI
jgi:phosphoribosylanthranilate isomerase